MASSWSCGKNNTSRGVVCPRKHGSSHFHRPVALPTEPHLIFIFYFFSRAAHIKHFSQLPPQLVLSQVLKDTKSHHLFPATRGGLCWLKCLSLGVVVGGLRCLLFHSFTLPLALCRSCEWSIGASWPPSEVTIKWQGSSVTSQETYIKTYVSNALTLKSHLVLLRPDHRGRHSSTPPQNVPQCFFLTPPLSSMFRVRDGPSLEVWVSGSVPESTAVPTCR